MTDIKALLEPIGLPASALEWLCDLWLVTQVLDDRADGDKTDAAENAAAAIFVRMPMNPFYDANRMALIPVLAVQLAKWRAANAAENAGLADEKSFMWRAGYYDVVAAACILCGIDGEVGLHAYGEPFADYKKEFA
ncbi:MAG: hypothetical protein U5N55_04900 [Cypionkella sp.]|nr:hypothetical protein [Cypionkella sp.]